MTSHDFRSESTLVNQTLAGTRETQLRTHGQENAVIKIVVTPPLDHSASKVKNRKFQKAYTIDVQGWQNRQSSSKIVSLNDNRSIQLESDSGAIKTEVEFDQDGEEIVEARDMAICTTSIIDNADEDGFN